MNIITELPDAEFTENVQKIYWPKIDTKSEMWKTSSAIVIIWSSSK